VEVLNQHNVPTRIIDQPDQDRPTIRRSGQAGPTTGGLVELADSPNISANLEYQKSSFDCRTRFFLPLHG
jgi:hypothetical protein